MKIFTNKNVVQKVVIAILIVLSFNFIVPSYSQAGFGGTLMGPVIDLIAGIGDALLSALQYWMYDGQISVGSAVGGAVNTSLTLVNPFDSFLLTRGSKSVSEIENILAQYDMQGDGDVDIEVDTENFDKGWLGWLPGSVLDKDYGIPIIKYTPEAIFGNRVPALDVNFINPRDWGDDDMNSHSVTQDLRSTIASWYVALRNLALVILLSVLLYVGIRIVISSTASDKAKYKQMIINWVVAVCILFFLHYIMSFILSVVEIITDGISSGSSITVRVIDGSDQFTMNTDLTGLVRFQIQYSDLGARLIYLIFYLALVIYTVMFTWTYIKRAITMAFLTLMAPLVAITYPIDKIGDGQAQAFNIWLREFIFNALLQPFHLIVYSIFMGGAADIAVKNPIYAILFLAFIIPAEKLLRKMFGFDKSSTAGAMSTAAGIFGGAAAFKAVSGLISKGANVAKGAKSGGGSNGIRTKTPLSQKAPSAIAAFGTGSGTSGNNSGQNGGQGTQTPSPDQAARDQALEKYRSEGFGQNANGEYFNPWTSEYDPDYDPTQDISYNTQLNNPSTSGSSAGAGQVSQATQQRMNRLQTPQSSQPAPQMPQTSQTSQPRQQVYQSPQSTRLQDNKNWGWTDNDTRGAGAYLRDGISRKWNNSEAKKNLLDSGAYKRVKAGGESIRDFANARRQGLSNTINKIPKPLRNSARGALAVAGKVGKAGIKAAGVATLAGVGATVGLAAGIAGDDLEDVLTYGAAGAALGATGLPALGKGIASGVSEAATNVATTYNTAAYGNREAALKQQNKEWIDSDQNKEDMVQGFMDRNDGRRPTRAETKELMESGADYYNSGITENKDIIKAMKLEKEIKERLANEGIEEANAKDMAKLPVKYIADKVNGYTKADLRDDEKVAGLREDITKDLRNGGVEKSVAEKQAISIIEDAKRLKGVTVSKN